MTPTKTVPRSLSLYPEDWEALDKMAADLQAATGEPVKAPRVVRNLLKYGSVLLLEAHSKGLERL